MSIGQRKIVMSFTDDDIRAIVETAQYTDPLATEYMTKTLIARRDRIGRTYFAKVWLWRTFALLTRDSNLKISLWHLDSFRRATTRLPGFIWIIRAA